MFELVIRFLFYALLIVVAGIKLSKYGDLIAEKSGLDQALIGGILIATVTALPEVVTSSTAATINAPDIAIGNLYGSNTFNMMILALADLIQGPGPFLLHIQLKHILAALIGILLSTLGALFILINYFLSTNFTFLGLGLGSIAILFTYIIGERLIFRYQKKNQTQQKTLTKKMVPLKVFLKFLLVAAIIVIAGINLSRLGDQLALATGVDRAFVGTILIAAATSLPEMVTVIGAVRINAYDMAAGNIIGSNIFNMVIIVLVDLFYTSSPVLANVTLEHIITALIGLVLSTILVIGLFYRSQKSFLNVGWDSAAIITVYLLGAYLLFRLGINF
ncbi:sodium:calcium antiporter [Fuchsiella alkaliacetigena]|uniref:sodium:calcium antiporter n=1 Tax=Fuchsiella alkaliacetigena TaxID=957042 RepID=UPI00200A1A23|nr:sodium:calcium antiporter [Fuchsiella alkaliacetigena]MCK8824604.1 sodium:calcium antiporter [Fuchsiella alkaliacetigena]